MTPGVIISEKDNSSSQVKISRGTGSPILVNAPSPSPPAAPYVTDNLLAYLDAGNAASYPGTGTTWTDLTGNGYNGTLINGPTYSSENGGSILFTRPSQYGFIAPDINLQRDFTLEMWVNTLTFAGGTLFSQGTPAANAGLHIGWFGSIDISYRMYFNDIGSNTVSSANTWYHFAFTYSDTTFRKEIYRNATLLNGTNAGQSKYVGSGVLAFGITSWGPDPLGGYIAMMRAYSKVLSSAEVLQNYNVDKARFGY